MKKILATFLALSKVSLLVLLSSMNMWGNSAMAMPCEKNMKMNQENCQICIQAAENLSEPFVQLEKKLEIKNFAGFQSPFAPFLKGECVVFLKSEKEIYPPPKLLTRNSYLFAKKTIVLVI